MVNRLKNMTLGTALILSFGLVGLYWFMSYDSGEAIQFRINKLTSEVSQKRTQIAKLNASLVAAKKYEIVEQKMGEILGRIITYIPGTMRSVDVLRLIQKEAVLSELNIIRMDNSKGMNRPVEGAPFVKLPVSAQFEGDFVRIMEFLSALTKLDKIVTVEEMRFTLNSKKKVFFTATFMGYKYVEESKGGQ